MLTTQAHLVLQKVETNAGYTEIKLGKAEVVINYNIILHIVNPAEIKNIIDQLETNLLKIELDPIKKSTLQHEIRALKTKLKVLVPHRYERGLFNFIGTIHKWLYGTMDNQDREEIESHLSIIDTNNHNIINNVNQQVRINTNFNQTFIKLKEIIEKDRVAIASNLNHIGSDNRRIYIQVTYIDFVLKLKILSDNIEHIQENIASSRLGILHSNILTSEEIEEYKIDLQKFRNIKLGTVVDNLDNLIFVIMVPKDIILADKSIIVPMTSDKHEEIILDNTEIIRYNNKTYSYTENKDLKNQKIYNSCLITKNCMKTFNNVSQIIELDRGIVIAKNLNQANLSSDCDERRITLNGNYLLSLHNCSIKINNHVIYNKEKEFKQSFIIPNQLENLENLNKKLTFDDIILQQIENTKQIDELKFQKHSHFIYSGTITVTLLLIVIIIGIYMYKTKKEKIKINNVFKTQESSEAKEGEVTSTFHTPHYKNLKNNSQRSSVASASRQYFHYNI